MRDKTPLRVSKIFFFSQRTQMNRTHKGPQRHQVNRFHRTLQPQRASPPAPLRMERGVITEIPLYVLRMIRMYSPPVSRPIGVTSHTTPLSIRRGAGGEASVFSVCRRPSVGSKCAQKSSVNSVRSVRDKTPQRVSQLFFFSQKNRTHKVSQRHQVNRFHRTLQPFLAITFCEFCMPEAFCEFETVRKKVLLSL